MKKTFEVEAFIQLTNRSPVMIVKDQQNVRLNEN
jgi:hypothetical protein